MGSRIPSYLREAAHLLMTELNELRDFTQSVQSQVEATPVPSQEETLRKFSRELAGRYHRAQGAAGFLQLVELSRFAKGVEDLFRSVQEKKTLETEIFVTALRDATSHLKDEIAALQQEIAQS